jgi:hypothetical protein
MSDDSDNLLNVQGRRAKRRTTGVTSTTITPPIIVENSDIYPRQSRKTLSGLQKSFDIYESELFSRIAKDFNTDRLELESRVNELRYPVNELEFSAMMMRPPLPLGESAPIRAAETAAETVAETVVPSVVDDISIGVEPVQVAPKRGRGRPSRSQ